MTKIPIGIIAVVSLAMAGCESRSQPRSTSPVTSNPSEKTSSTSETLNNVPEQWLGKWIGPEGTYLVLAKQNDKYIVEIHSLDGAAGYDGVAAGDRIEFQRNGKSEFIHAGNGEETGMKWLLDKKNCLIIRTGEGFCRD